jgi:flagellar basal body rod protein FlgG
MDPAYYVAAGSLKARSLAMDVVANNLANASTHGFKPDRTFFTLFNKAKGAGLPKQLNDGTVVGNRGTNLDQGALIASGRPLDVALQGPGFLVVRSPQGELLTRDGRLKLGQDGQLQAMDGLPLLGKGGQPLTVDPAAGRVTIAADGSVQQGGATVGQLELRDVANPLGLKKIGNSRFDAANAQPQPASPNTTLAQGHLEQSGVDMPSAMVEMIKTNRLFEMSMKVASTVSNDLDARSINDVGGLR